MTFPKSLWRGGRVLTQGLALLGLAALAAADTNEPRCRIWFVWAGGQLVMDPTKANAGRVTTLKRSAALPLQFSFGPDGAETNQPTRLRHKLEGWDQDWQEASEAKMQLLVITYAASNQFLSIHGFPMSGETHGWKRVLPVSSYHLRRETIVVPGRAERLQVLLVSGEPSVLGAAAIAGFRVLHQRSADGIEENIWPDPNLEEGEHLDRADGQPRYWQRGSVGAHMARLSRLGGRRALMIVDDDLNLSASWQAEVALEDRVRPGDSLTLEWREAYSVGSGGRNRATYDSLPPGDYVFRVQTFTPVGEPLGREVAFAVSIPQVFWKRPPFVASAAIVSAAAIALIVRTTVRRRLQARLDRLEHSRALEQERLRIAQDIHDDLGAGLTQINLLSQTALNKIEPAHPARADIARLHTLTVNLTHKLDEIVWAVSPRHDTLESLVSYLTDLAEEFLGAAGIRTRIQIPLQLPDWTLPSGLRHNVFLATKETLNNIVKHANATEVHLRLDILPTAFELTIEDNGCGFSLPPIPPSGSGRRDRNGLGGIRERIESLGGRFTLDSGPGRGTRAMFTVPVNVAEADVAGTQTWLSPASEAVPAGRASHARRPVI